MDVILSPALSLYLITILLLLSTAASVTAQRCGSNQKLCGDVCVGILDFCTRGPSRDKCGLGRECADGTCVSLAAKCRPAYCRTNHKRCFTSGTCVERGSNCCAFFYHECDDGSCLRLWGDKYCECPILSNFHCDNKECIDRSKWCNGRAECNDGSDELGCTTVPPGDYDFGEFDSPGVNTAVLIPCLVAGAVVFIVLILCMRVCSRRKPQRSRYWRRRERSFTDQSPSARTTDTLVRNTRSDLPVPLSTQASVTGDGAEPSPGLVMDLPVYEETEPSSTPQAIYDDNELPPSYDEVIKNTPIVTAPDDASQNNSNC